LLDLKANSGRELCVLALVRAKQKKIGFFLFRPATLPPSSLFTLAGFTCANAAKRGRHGNVSGYADVSHCGIPRRPFSFQFFFDQCDQVSLNIMLSNAPVFVQLGMKNLKHAK
jgi:hypothetical protein